MCKIITIIELSFLMIFINDAKVLLFLFIEIIYIFIAIKN